jgi:hypothetical protein
MIEFDNLDQFKIDFIEEPNCYLITYDKGPMIIKLTEKAHIPEEINRVISIIRETFSSKGGLIIPYCSNAAEPLTSSSLSLEFSYIYSKSNPNAIVYKYIIDDIWKVVLPFVNGLNSVLPISRNDQTLLF